MCKFSSKSGGVPFQPLGDLTWNDPFMALVPSELLLKFAFMVLVSSGSAQICIYVSSP